MKITQDEMALLIDDFVNLHGLWPAFVEYLNEKGYEPEDLGLKNE